MPKSFSDLMRMPYAALAIFAACAAALLFAFVMQFGFDIEPCVLCLWQRLPFGLAALLSLIALSRKPYGPGTRVLLSICALLFAAGAATALFHTGVELHWWLGTKGCAVQPLTGSSPEDLRTALLHTAVARCDEIAWTFLGLSMANWNVLFSGALAAFAFDASRRIK